MEMAVAPRNITAMSMMWKSMMLRIISTTRSPGPMPRPSRAVVTTATRSAYSR
jgi:hypothetical protein